MKILMLGWELPPHNSGGLGVACLSLSKALAKEGAEIDFVVPYEAEHEAPHMRVLPATHLQPPDRWGVGSYDSWRVEEKVFPGKRGSMSLREVQRDYCAFVERYLMGYKPDCVHAHDWLTYEAGMLAKRNFGLPLVAHVHATEYDRGGGEGGNPLIHAIEREALMLADRIIAVSQATKNIIVERYEIPADKVEVGYNGFEKTGDYEYAQTYRYVEWLKEQGYTVVSTVGRFTLQKGLSYMMRAAARALAVHPKMIFVFAGDGEQRDELLELAAELQFSEKVLFTGFVRGKRLRDVYGISDVFVMSSLSEPFGLTALEAAHQGNALVLTKQSGVGEVLQSVMRYDFWDEEKLADCLVGVAESKALASMLRDGVSHEYGRLSWGKVAKKCLVVYDEVIKRKRNIF